MGMNQQLRRRMQKVFAAPLPDRQEKARFFQTLPPPRISLWRFVWTQAAYLRKRTWLLSALLLLPAWLGAYSVGKNTLWVISALTPCLGLLAVTENARSVVYGMNELEMSARFSLKSVILARMGVLGALDVFLLCCLTPLCSMGTPFTPLQTAFYLLVPYLLTVNVELWITRRFRGKEAVYGCMGVTAMIIGANGWLHLAADFVYQLSYVKWWAALFIVLAGRMVYEVYRTMQRTEELVWN